MYPVRFRPAFVWTAYALWGLLLLAAIVWAFVSGRVVR